MSWFPGEPRTPTTCNTWGPLRHALHPLPQEGARVEGFSVLVLHSRVFLPQEGGGADH
jgi:hypothetical protein